VRPFAGKRQPSLSGRGHSRRGGGRRTSEVSPANRAEQPAPGAGYPRAALDRSAPARPQAWRRRAICTKNPWFDEVPGAGVVSFPAVTTELLVPVSAARHAARGTGATASKRAARARAPEGQITHPSELLGKNTRTLAAILDALRSQRRRLSRCWAFG